MKVMHIFFALLILLLSKFIFDIEIGIVVYWLISGVVIYGILALKYWSMPVSDIQQLTLVKMARIPYLLLWGFLLMMLHKSIAEIIAKTK